MGRTLDRFKLGTAKRRSRGMTCFAQAVLIVHRFLDATRVARLAAKHQIGASAAYRYQHEGINALAAQAPDLRTALDQAARPSDSTKQEVQESAACI